MTIHEDLISYIEKELALTERALELSYQLQWDRASPHSGEDAGIRSIGGVSDPTGELACDSGRLGVRSAMKKSEKLLTTAYTSLRETRTILEVANGRWDS